MADQVNSSDVDKIIYFLIWDDKFADRFFRREVDQAWFTSDVRQKIFNILKNYYGKYGKTPKDDFLDFFIEEVTRSRWFKNEHEEIFAAYFEKLEGIGKLKITSDFLLDKIDLIVKERIVNTTINRLLKMQERISLDPNIPINVMREALESIEKGTGDKLAESILDDQDYKISSEVVSVFGIKEIDKALGGGLRLGEYIVLQGYTGVGKSWTCIHLLKMAARLGTTSLFVPMETSNKEIKIRIRQSFTGLTREEISNGNFASVKNKIEKSMLSGSDIMVLSENEKSISVVELPNVVKDTEERTGRSVRFIVLDSVDDMTPPPGRYKNQLEANTASHVFVKNYAVENELCILSTAQVTREGEGKWWLTGKNVADNINKIRKATAALSINQIESEKPYGFLRYYLFKQNNGPTGARAWAKANHAIGQCIIDCGKYNHEEYRQMLEEAKNIEGEFFVSRN